jgi:hypothetical protein
VVDTSLGQHGVVFQFRLSQRRAVSRDDDELGLSIADGLESLLISKNSLSRLHNELETRVDGLDSLLGLLRLNG